MVKALQQGKFNLENLTLDRVPASALGGVNADDSDPVPVLYQSGYLTIKNYDERWQSYNLKYPNKEVERGFMECLAKTYVPSASYNSPFAVSKFVEDFEKGDAEGLMQRFEAFFADADYEIVGDAELYFQNTMYVMTKLMGRAVCCRPAQAFQDWGQFLFRHAPYRGVENPIRRSISYFL